MSLTNSIRYYIIRNSGGLNFGSNYHDIIITNTPLQLWNIIGTAGINLDDYAAFFGLNFNYEHHNRTMVVNNKQDIYFVDRRIVAALPPTVIANTIK